MCNPFVRSALAQEAVSFRAEKGLLGLVLFFVFFFGCCLVSLFFLCFCC